ncbi:polyketide synthase PksD, partial [Xylaria palmicola]
MEPVAVVGLSFRLPQGAEDESSLWDVLESRKNVMTTWPESRANIDAFYNDKGTMNTLPAKGAHFLKGDPAAFDAPFFSVTAKEARSMDPQQRWLLETSYRALENAGIPVEKVAGTDAAVYSSSMAEDFMRIVAKDPDEAPMATPTGTTPCMLANRLSWYFDLKGPSIQVNTACSSSMIAMDIACRSLQTGQIPMALVTGSNIILSPETSIYLSNMKFLSPDSVSHSFDERANGYARGEGVVVLVLKRLSDALEAGDAIRAVIRATGVNQDGHTPGLTQPSLSSQEKLIRQVYKSCSLDFGLTRYVEAHGTGTQIGDSTEIRALGRVFKNSRTPNEPLYVGSIKANIGHLEGCSGLAGIIKCIFVLERGVIPPNAIFERINPNINVKSYKIQIPTTSIQWPCDGLRRVSVNSFGLGGANGHLIMDDAFHTILAVNEAANTRTLASSALLGVGAVETHSSPNFTRVGKTLENGYHPAPVGNNRQLGSGDADEDMENHKFPPMNGLNGASNGIHVKSMPVDSKHMQGMTNGHTHATEQALMNYKLFVWSAKDEAGLDRVCEKYKAFYESDVHGHRDTASRLAYTLAARRSIMPWKSFAVLSTDDSSSPSSLSPSKGQRSSREPDGIAFVFTGQGAQYARMGLELLCYPVFRSVIYRADRAFQSLGASWSLYDELYSGERINTPELSQPLCTALQIALVELLNSLKISPDVVVGHSSGEIAAAYTVGALSLESACKIAYHRGRLAGHLIRTSADNGAMMSVNLSEGAIEAYLEDSAVSNKVHVACINSPFNVTLSGDAGALDTLKERFDSEGIFARRVNTGVAYHSPAMVSIAEEYLDCLSDIESRNPNGSNILMISSVTGQKVPASSLSVGEYWVNNLMLPVRFADAMQYVVVAATRMDGLRKIHQYIEVGPHAALQRPIKDTLTEATGGKAFQYSSVLSRFTSPLETTLRLVGQLFADGYPVSVEAANQSLPASQGVAQHLVNAPEYPFDHSQSYWHESRLSRDWRLRGDVPNSLLGVRATDWNPLAPRWRKVLSVEEIPWLADHVVGEQVIFPGAGTLMMALEAVRKASGPQPIKGYQIKEASFTNPIIIKPEGRTEVLTHLRTLQWAYEKTSSRFEVQVFSYGDDWTECFKAVIHTEYAENSKEVDGGHETLAATDAAVSNFQSAKTASTKHIEKEKFYNWLCEKGLRYGETFAIAEGIHWDGNNLCVAEINAQPSEGPFDGIVHPGVLDACFQICVTAPSNGLSRSLPTMVPHRIQNAWISATGWRDQSHKIQTASYSKMKPGEGGLECSVFVLADETSLLCHVKQIDMVPISSETSGYEGEKRLFHAIDSKPQLSLLGPDQLRRHCKADDFPSDEGQVIDQCSRLESILQGVIRDNIDQLQETNWSTAPSHMRNYVSWMEGQLRQVPDGSSSEIKGQDLVTQLEELQDSKPSWGLFADIARNLSRVVSGEIKGDDLLHASQFVRDFYKDSFNPSWADKLASYIRLSAHQNPSQRILEVGNSTTDVADHVLSTLLEIEDHTRGVSFAEYVYTDVSPSDLQASEARLSTYKDRIGFKLLDPVKDLASQGVQAQEYDMAILTISPTTVASLSTTIQNLRRSLKPGGHLIMRGCVPGSRIAMTFGLGISASWWHKDGMPGASGHMLSESEWDGVLKENGFSGADMVIRDRKDDAAHFSSILISTAVEDTKPADTEISRVLFVTERDDEHQRRMAASLSKSIKTSWSLDTAIFSIAQLEEANVSVGDIVVWLAGVGMSLLADIPASSFQLVKDWILRSENILWVSSRARSEDPDSLRQAYAGVETGLLRTLRAEFTSKRIVSLILEDPASGSATGSLDQVRAVFGAAFIAQSPELEYVVDGGDICTHRAVEENEMNKLLASSEGPQTSTQPWAAGTPVMLDIGTRGSLETLQFTEDFSAALPLGPTEVEIEARAWGVNFRDVFIALGRLDETEFGSDCAGVVTRVGPECQSVKPGDRVCMCAIGCMRGYPRADESAVVKIADSVPFDVACGVIGPATTAWYSLVEIGRLKKHEKVLIHAASGATGQLAIQVAQLVGAEVFATVGYDYKKELLTKTYGIPDDHIFFSRNTSFAKGIMRVTGGYGVDVVLNSLVGEGLRATWECVAPYGRFVEIGKADIYANASLPMAAFAGNVSFCAVDLRHIMLHKTEIARPLLLKAASLAEEGAIRCPAPLNVYKVSAVEDAFRYIQNGRNTGRTVIRIDGSTEVQKCITQKRLWKFRDDAAYIVVGGLGGIGRSILKWMASKGAKHIIAPSRSGVTTRESQNVMEALLRDGVDIVTPRCDVSSASSLSALVEQYRETMPPIRGCINAAMALNDSLFQNLTHEQWDVTIRSKVQTSWNLHALLPRDLDFFILLSSTAGILGNMGQPNYAAGCAFQDALARHRKSALGDRSLSLDLGVMSTIGVIAESASLQRRFEAYVQIDEAAFLSVLDICCDPAQPLPAGQLAVGLVTPAELLARGFEPTEVVQRPLMAYFSERQGAAGRAASGDGAKPGALFRAAEAAEDRATVVVEALRKKLARALGISSDDIEGDKPLHAFGVDSLVAVELRNWMAKEFAASLAVHEIMGSRTVEAIGEMVERVSAIKTGS